jgi:hypothetical protein
VRAEEGERPVAERPFEDPYGTFFREAGAHAAEATQRHQDLPSSRLATAASRWSLRRSAQRAARPGLSTCEDFGLDTVGRRSLAGEPPMYVRVSGIGIAHV